jgi:hypothetical protein
MGTGSFPGVKLPGRGVDHPPTSSSEVKERVDLFSTSRLDLLILFYVDLYFDNYSSSSSSSYYYYYYYYRHHNHYLLHAGFFL